MKKIFNSRVFIVSLIMFLFFSISSIGAQEQLAGVYKQIDVVFKEKNFDGLNEILRSNFGSEYYTLYESYSLKKTRLLIIEGDLDNARTASLIVIDNNLENFDAVELYSYIDRAILNKESAMLAEARKKELEAARIAAQQERTKKQVQKTFNTVESSSGSKIYRSDMSDNFSRIKWNAGIGVADIFFQNTTEPNMSTIKYGVAADVDVVYTGDQFYAGGELFGNFEFLSFGKENKDLYSVIRFVPKVAFPIISKHLFFRIGFGAYLDLESSDSKKRGHGTFYSPLAGVAWEKQKIGNSELKVNADCCLMGFAEENMNAAFDMGASILVPLSSSEHTKVGFRLGVSDLLILDDSGVDNRCNVILSIGVGNVDR